MSTDVSTGMSTDADVLVLGGGMAGGMLAAALANTPLHVRVLDGAPAPVMPDGEPGLRVSALSEASQRMLAATGAWQQLPAGRLGPYTRMAVWDADGTGRVEFSAAEAGADQLGWILENDACTAALHAACTGADNLEWECGVRVTAMERNPGPASGGWQLRDSDGRRLRAPLLVGADGANSLVRERAGIPSAPRNTGHVALVATIETEQDHGGCARQRFMEGGPLALLPLFGTGHLVSIVWSLPPEQAESLMQCDDAAFAERLTAASEACLGRLRPVSRRVVFPVRELHASDYVRDGLALIGDAAHVIHPLAGQGINLGLLDAAVLAEEMLRAREQGLDFHDPRALQRYQRRRRGHNLLMLNSMRGFKRLFEQRAPGLRFLRNRGMSLVNDTAPLKALFARQALGRGGDLPWLARGGMSS